MKKAELDRQCAEFTAEHGLDIQPEHKLVLDHYIESGMDETESWLTFACQFPGISEKERAVIFKKYLIARRNDPHAQTYSPFTDPRVIVAGLFATAAMLLVFTS